MGWLALASDTPPGLQQWPLPSSSRVSCLPEVTRILLFAAQASHQLVPPEVSAPVTGDVRRASRPPWQRNGAHWWGGEPWWSDPSFLKACGHFGHWCEFSGVVLCNEEKQNICLNFSKRISLGEARRCSGKSRCRPCCAEGCVCSRLTPLSDFSNSIKLSLFNLSSCSQIIQSVLMTIANNFVTDKNSGEVMTVG